MNFNDNFADRCTKRDKDGTAADFYYFVPALSGVLKKAGDSIEFAGKCFKYNKLTLTSASKNELKFELKSDKPNNIFCNDYYVFSTSRIHEMVTVSFRRTIHLTFKKVTNNDFIELAVSGIRVFNFCQSPEKELFSLLKTVRLYLGGFSPKHGHVPKEMVKANVDFVKRYANLDFKPRNPAYAKKILPIDKNSIKSGDFLGVTRLDGVDQLIMMGTGSTFGHSTFALWIEGELYVVESQDGWYWPRHGIQKNKFDDWIKWAHNADFIVVLLPINEKYRAKFDEEKAVKFYFSKEGLNYGYHNFLASWLDGKHNMPKFLDTEALMFLMSIFDKILPAVYDKILGESMNMRLNTKGLNIVQTVLEAAKRNITYEDLLAIPELEGWVYSDGENYVCSSFGVGIYKAAGLFDNLEIQPQEFSPKDIYNLDFFVTDSDKRPEICKQADPNSPFCYIMGSHSLDFKNLGVLQPYNKMNERCNSESPLFIRNEGC